MDLGNNYRRWAKITIPIECYLPIDILQDYIKSLPKDAKIVYTYFENVENIDKAPELYID